MSQYHFGRPPKFEKPEDLAKKVEAYFKWCDDQGQTTTDSKGNERVIRKPYTITGLCVYLGISRHTWCEYADKPEFRDITEAAKLRVENYTEESALTGRANPVFSIFSLKNNFGWVDQQTINTTQEPEHLTMDEIKRRLHKVGEETGT